MAIQRNVYPVAREGVAYLQILRRCDGVPAKPCNKTLVTPDPHVPVALCQECSDERIAHNVAAFAKARESRREA